MPKKTDEAAVDKTVATPVSDDNKSIQPSVEPSVEPTPEPSDDGKEAVNLVGTVGQKTGEHGVYADGRLIALFKDGVARVEREIAKLLKELGIAE